MVRGIDRFRDHFSDYESSYVLIGGVAAELWFAAQELTFRVTKDFDVVLIVEVLSAGFVRRIREFVDEGGYAIRERTNGTPMLYRFEKPSSEEHPSMLGLFARATIDGSDPVPGDVAPVVVDRRPVSLSAILMDDAYYRLVLENRETRNGIPIVTPACLAVLKARAWSDLRARKAAGEQVDERDLKKHRNDVFKLILLMAAEERIEVPGSIAKEWGAFLDAFPANALEWADVHRALDNTFGKSGVPRSIEAIRERTRGLVHLGGDRGAAGG
ncbi:MAG TPA: hypothetical protein VJP77_09115 [Planctomycetota bacterium]|nr:hypothetical protein [Planctomycetota bacterium]